GECEGDIACNLGALNLTDGKYLSLYPNGAHSEEAMTNLVKILQETMPLLESPAQNDAQYKADGQKQLAILRPHIMKTASPQKSAMLKLIDRYAQYFR